MARGILAGMSATEFETLGCRLNSFESAAMRELADREGVTGAVVVNTCAVTAEAVRKSRRAIRRMRREFPDSKLVATGCAAQIDPESFGRMDEVDLVLGNDRKLSTEAWRDIASGRSWERRVLVDDVMRQGRIASRPVSGFGGRTRALVQVQNGCDHRCTFCIIPYGRGNARSVDAASVVEQIQLLVGRGFREVVLTGVDITSWGSDLPGTPMLGSLVLRILRNVDDLERLRLSSIDPVEIDRDLKRAIAEEDRFMPHLHLSLQAGDNMILKRMKRRHSREDATGICDQLRDLRPDIAFGADLIAGFPTETDEMFENTERLVRECDIAWLHVFPFNPRPGTPAARMPQVPRNKIAERAARLRELGRTQAEAELRRWVNRTCKVLAESESAGRTEQFAEVIIDGNLEPGSLAEVRMTGIDGNRLAGTVAEGIGGLPQRCSRFLEQGH